MMIGNSSSSTICNAETQYKVGFGNLFYLNGSLMAFIGGWVIS